LFPKFTADWDLGCDTSVAIVVYPSFRFLSVGK